MVTMLVAGMAPARPAASACAGATVVSDVATLPPAWRSALSALVQATRASGRPWSCSPADLTLRLQAPGGPARLTVTLGDGPAMERSIAAPDEVVPVGEALLALPLPAPAQVTEAPRRPVGARGEISEPHEDAHILPALGAGADLPGGPRLGDRAEARPGEEGAPRLLLDALASTRYSGAAVWAGGAVRASLPFGRWTMGFWGRFDAAVRELQPVPFDFLMWSGSVGLSGGYRFTLRQVEILAALEPSVAIVNMDGGLDATPMSATGAKADLRVGPRLQAALPFSERWRALVALDGEIAPMSLANARHRMLDPRLPPMPTFTLGASLGGELSLR